ncbi:MAG: glycosyltransferase [Bacteroidales bacterium]|nr:glycosyltransferase [Bacteroidales bacterium]
MKVLFISSGKSGDVGNVVKNQGESLIKAGISISYYPIKSGFSGYMRSVAGIRKAYRQGKYDLAHAHYGLSGFAAAFAGCSPLVVSLMGSDIYFSRLLRLAAFFFYRYRWDLTIVKSQQMKEKAGLKKAIIVPNGVNLERFVPMEKSEARKHLDLRTNNKIILFIADPGRHEKNHELAEKASGLLENEAELICINSVPNVEIPYYLNASDVLLLTSRWEGSVNVIKEAMSCCTPVVSTRAGDAEWLLGNLPGHFLCSPDESDIAEKLRLAITYKEHFGKTRGRQRIKELKLDSVSVSNSLALIYKEVMTGNEDNN